MVGIAVVAGEEVVVEVNDVEWEDENFGEEVDYDDDAAPYEKEQRRWMVVVDNEGAVVDVAVVEVVAVYDGT